MPPLSDCQRETRLLGIVTFECASISEDIIENASNTKITLSYYQKLCQEITTLIAQKFQLFFFRFDFLPWFAQPILLSLIPGYQLIGRLNE